MRILERLLYSTLPINNIRKMGKTCRQRKIFSPLLTDLSKALDYLNHELLTGKLNVYGFNLPALRSEYDDLTNRKQRIETKNTYSNCMEIIF